jgi:hypothetical protein
VIEGEVRRGRPYLAKVRIVVPGFGVQQDLTFLLDTGSITSLIQPYDQGLLRISQRHFGDHVPGLGRGMGGTHSYYVEPCDIFVMHTDANRITDRLRLEMRFARPSRTNADLPSVLGVDFLHYYRMTFEPASEFVSLELRQ